MAETQYSYVVVALGAFWHRGALIETAKVFEATRKERITLVAANSVRDANDQEREAFYAAKAEADAAAKAEADAAAKAEADAAAKAEADAAAKAEADAAEAEAQAKATADKKTEGSKK